MNNTVIKITNLSKEYRLGSVGYGTLGQDLQRLWAKAFNQPDPNSIIGKPDNRQINQTDRILALNNIILNVKQGDRLGIIGNNGAGKTTLLKILSRISAPSKGVVKINGRVASLIAVGAGFHGELTGRENIFLNGTIMGLSKLDVKNRFDEIVDFSGVEQFIDTPVKRYSSGMYIRLGFAVAAHLDPDILIVDEVLAVGDAEFQKKAILKMKNVSINEGRTILFVSHNMALITSLCDQAICLEHGNIVNSGRSSDVVNKYISDINDQYDKGNNTKSNYKSKGDYTKLLNAGIEKLGGGTIREIDIRNSFKIIMEYEIIKKLDAYFYPNFHIRDSEDRYVFVTSANIKTLKKYAFGKFRSEVIIPGNLLNNGLYFVSIALGFLKNGTTDDFMIKNAITFTIIDPIEETLLESRNNYSGHIPGPIRPRLEWKVLEID